MQLEQTHLKLRLASWLSEPSSLGGISHGETLSSHLPIKKKQRREMHQFQNRYYTFKTVTLIKKMMCSTVCQNFKVPLLCYFKDS